MTQTAQGSLTMVGLNTPTPQVFWNGIKVAGVIGVGVPLVVTATSRVAGDLSQTISTVSGTTTVSAACFSAFLSA